VTPLLEICVDNVEDAHLAAASGADRIELTAALSEGGLTPSLGLVEAAAALPVPVWAMIRPRGGGFRHTFAEAALMARDIEAARSAGVAGVVLGATTSDGTLDEPLLADLLAAAMPLPATLHRAFDLTPDPFAALETAIRLGFAHILTSGQAPRATEGASLLAQLIARAGGRIVVMPGAGITPNNVADLLRRTGATEIHASCAAPAAPDRRAAAFGFEPPAGRRRTNRAAIVALRTAMQEAIAPDAMHSKTIPIT
jgi:copper homeostasis protein